MILPGISGSFILLLLGTYHTVIGALKEKDLMIIFIFGSGCIVGILSFARVLKFLFSKYKNQTITLLTGFMLGSLQKVWPWKKEVGDAPLVVHSDGREEWLMANVMPQNFEGDPLVVYSILLAIGGLLLVLTLERFAPNEA
jgi:putative membrane protein